MAEPLRNQIDLPLLQCTAAHLRRVWRGFPAAHFVRLAGADLDRLALKQRVVQVAAALAATLPDDFDRAAAVIERSLAPAGHTTANGALQPGEAGLAGWIVWPFGEFVAARGLDQPQRALATLHALTQRFTAEFSIRPFLVAHEALTLATLRGWVTDPSPHVRRLCSEGSRPRLPWGQRLARFVADPTPTLPILAALQDDPSDYVRRSVANHLNDIAKDHPQVVADWLARHLPGAPPARRALLRHASRTLLKRGDRAVLKAFGLDRPLRGAARFSLAPRRLRRGEAIELRVALTSTARVSQRLVVDYVVHRVLQRGGTSPQIRKGWKLDLPAGATRTLARRHSLRPVTTRTDHPGRHEVELVVNGRKVAAAVFMLLP